MKLQWAWLAVWSLVPWASIYLEHSSYQYLQMNTSNCYPRVLWDASPSHSFLFPSLNFCELFLHFYLIWTKSEKSLIHWWYFWQMVLNAKFIKYIVSRYIKMQIICVIKLWFLNFSISGFSIFSTYSRMWIFENILNS